MSSRYGGTELNRRREATNALLMGFGVKQEEDWMRKQQQKKNNAHRRSGNNARLEPEGVGRLRSKLSAKGVHGLHSMVRLLRIMDDNGDGFLTKEELKYGLEDLGVKLNRAELDELFEYFDADESGTITQDEFVRGIRGPMSKSRERLVEAAFEKLDKTHDGCVTLEDMELAYNPNHHPEVIAGNISGAQALREFLRQWDNLEFDSEVSYKEFLEYHKNLSAAIDSDATFKGLMNGFWGLGLSDPVSSSLEEGNQRRRASTSSIGFSPQEENIDIGNHHHREEDFEDMYMTTSRSTSKVYEHPDAPKPGKTKVPDWLKYHGQFVCFSLYSKETVHEHEGSFDPSTRMFKTTQQESFRIRTFVLKYYLEDHTAMITETTRGAPSAFASRGKLGQNINLEDLVVGNVVPIKGLNMHVVDADAKARAFFKEHFPKVKMPTEALLIPKEPTPKTTQTSTKNPALDASPLREKKTNASLKFIENDGKILRFDCIWDDPALYGERRYFRLHFYLGDDTMELREVNLRNSGRERTALLNLKRQKLPNPKRRDMEPYEPSDLKVGSTVVAFGREMQIVDCDDFTRQFYEEQGITQDDGVSRGRSQSASFIPEDKYIERYQMEDPTALNLYTSPTDQKFSQILEAIRATTEQRTRFGSEFEQKRMLMAYLKRYCDDQERMEMCKTGFATAMSGFSCFGSDIDLLFEKLAGSASVVPAEKLVAMVYPNQNGASIPSQMAPPFAPQPTNPVSLEANIKVRGLVESIRNKLEVMTNFGELRQQRATLLRILNNACFTNKNWITRSEFRGAMARLNCWEGDAFAIFDSIDVQNHGALAPQDIARAILP